MTWRSPSEAVAELVVLYVGAAISFFETAEFE